MRNRNKLFDDENLIVPFESPIMALTAPSAEAVLASKSPERTFELLQKLKASPSPAKTCQPLGLPLSNGVNRDKVKVKI